MNMKKVISFSIWGNSLHYVMGAILNADIAEKEWQDWICRFYISPNVPKEAIDELRKRDNVEVVEMEQDESWNGMFWRFFAASDPDVDVAIFRDTDSRLNVRDKAAVDEWLESDKDVHIIRDMCQHGWVICGGAWGVRGGVLKDIKHKIENFEIKKQQRFNKHGIDQMFLQYEIYSNLIDKIYVHDDWFPHQFPHEEKHSMPIPRLRGEGWWHKEIPEWHCGFEFEKGDGHWFRDETCKNPECCLPCPGCGEYHDNEFVGKQVYVNKDNIKKYEHLQKVLK